jgi:aminopeptidase N
VITSLTAAAAAAIGADAIEAELHGDSTAEGRRRAASARAATATAAAKAAAWDRMTGGDAPNWELEGLLRGFHQPDQDDLLAPYSRRYFAELSAVHEKLDGEMARGFAVAAFPRTQISEATVAQADEWLAAEPSPTMRRTVLEGRDRLVRALKAQACDREHGRMKPGDR